MSVSTKRTFGRKACAPTDNSQPDMRIAPNVDPPHPWALKKTFTYRGQNRETLFYVGRYDWFDAAGTLWEIYRSFTWSEADGWRCEPWQAPRPLYNLHNITAQPNLPVVLCGDEDAADSAGALGAGRWVASTWPGGAQQASRAAYGPLQGRKVIIWPDASPEGTLARSAVLDALSGIAREVWVVDVSSDKLPMGWSARTAHEEDGWDTPHLEGWLRDLVPDENGEMRPRLRKHVYDPNALPAGVVEMLESAATAPEPAMRPEARGHSDIMLSARHWEKASWRSKMVLIKGKNGKDDVAPKCVENALAPLLYDDAWKGLFGWNELRQCITAMRPTVWGEQPEEWVDHHYTSLECWYDRSRMFYGRGLIKQAVELVAHKNSFHPVRDYLNRLVWDGTPRLDEWLTVYCGTPRNDFSIFAGRSWMISAVARAMVPGIPVKTCLILFGPQDAGKSEVFRILGSPWYAVQNGAISGDSNKAIEQCSKVWIIEMAELTKVKRSDDLESIKSFISTYEDVYRPAYAQSVRTIPRCCVFCGTSNPKEVFSDVTGNVRFWPMEVYKEIDLDGLRRDRDQLWAEAVVRHRAGVKWWIEDSAMRELAHQATQDYMVRDEWATVIQEFISSPENRLRKSQAFTTSEIMSGALKIEVGKYSRAEQTRVSNCMRMLGYENTTVAYTKEEMATMPEGSPKQRKAWRKS